jgi:hypothetical protein
MDAVEISQRQHGSDESPRARGDVTDDVHAQSAWSFSRARAASGDDG